MARCNPEIKQAEGYTRADGAVGRVWRATETVIDTSPIYTGRFESACSLCHIGACHSTTAHRAKVAEYHGELIDVACEAEEVFGLDELERFALEGK